MKTVALSILAVALGLTSMVLAYSLLPLMITFAVAIAVSATAETIIHGWLQRGVSRSLSVLITYVLGIVTVALLAVAMVPSIGAELAALAKDAVPLYETFVLSWRQRGGAWALLASTLPSSASLSHMLSVRWQDLFKGALVFGESTASAVVVLVLAIYWSTQRAHMTAALHGLMPAKYRGEMRRTLAQMEVALGLHVVVEGVASLITLTAVFAVASVQGLPYPVLLSMVVALIRLVPFLGPPMCLAVGLVAGHSIDTTAAAVTGIAVLGIERLANALANNMLSHRRHNAFLVILVAVATVKLGGWVGLLVAPALASVLEVAAAHLRDFSSAKPEIEAAKFSERIDTLEAAVVQRGGARGRRLLPVLHKLQQMLKSQDVT